MFILLCIFAVLTLGTRATHLISQLEQKFNTLEQKVRSLEQKEADSAAKIIGLQGQMEYGGKKHPTLQYATSTPQLKDHDYLMLQFLGIKGGWLGCAGGACGLATCPSSNYNYYFYFNERCYGERLQIIGKGASHEPIKSGQQIRIRYLHEHNTWVSYRVNNQCGKGTCSGTSAQGSNFNRCPAEIFRIYARGKKDGEVVYNNDVVMLYNENACKYVSIQGEKLGDGSTFNFCPGVTPPAYLSYGICSKNAFRIYRRP